MGMLDMHEILVGWLALTAFILSVVGIVSLCLLMLRAIYRFITRPKWIRRL